MRFIHSLPILLLAFFSPLSAQANGAVNAVAVHGYDVVAYHTESKAVPGSGNFASYHANVTYLFSSKANKKAFEAAPEKYIPAYGGFCAFGVTKGKKFDGDPHAWTIVDGTLYLNLNKKVQKVWEKDIPGYIETANGKWFTIENIHPKDL